LPSRDQQVKVKGDRAKGLPGRTRPSEPRLVPKGTRRTGGLDHMINPAGRAVASLIFSGRRLVGVVQSLRELPRVGRVEDGA
jgi:hypothetical protein